MSANAVPAAAGAQAAVSHTSRHWLTTTPHTVAIGSLCSGYAGLDMGAAAALGGARLAWVADNDPDIAHLLAHRFPDVPNLGDLAQVRWRDVPAVDVITAGFPCQDISAAGRGAGIEKGAHSSVWTHVMDAIRHLRPALVLLENVPALRWKGRGFHIVLADLARAGYDAQWLSLRASDIGAPHRRERLFLAAHPVRQRRRTQPDQPPHAPSTRQAGPHQRCALPPAPRTRTGHQPHCPIHPALHHRCGTPAAAHAASQRRDQGQPQPAWQPRQPHPVLGTVADPHRCALWHQPLHQRGCQHAPEPGNTRREWGPYTHAIQRWEHILKREAPEPTEPGERTPRRLNPRFVEWMMGLDQGWVTDPALGLSRRAQLQALGNGVIPQQAHHAITHLLCDMSHEAGGEA